MRVYEALSAKKAMAKKGNKGQVKRERRLKGKGGSETGRGCGPGGGRSKKFSLGREILGRLIEEFRYISHDALYANASYLMLSNLVVAGSGLLFWIIAARLYAPEAIGLASALISLVGLFVMFSTSGFDLTLVRFVPSMKLKKRCELVFGSMAFTALVSLLLSGAFILLAGLLTPKLEPLLGFPQGLLFVGAAVFACLFYLSNGMFVARKRADFLFIKTLMQSALKVVALPLLVMLGAVGIFTSYALSLALALLLSLALVIKLYPKIRIRIDKDLVKKIYAFLAGNYVSSIFSQLPKHLFPIIILTLTSGEATALFYIPWHMFFAFLGFMGPVGLSLLMDCSYGNGVREGVSRALKPLFLVILGGLVLFFVFGEFVLSIFGAEYVKSAPILRVLALSLVPMGINQIYLTVKKIRKEVRKFTAVTILLYSSCLALGTGLIPYFGVIGVGYGWLIGQSLGAAWVGVRLLRGEGRNLRELIG